jgi:hypothetical protein
VGFEFGMMIPCSVLENMECFVFEYNAEETHHVLLFHLHGCDDAFDLWDTGVFLQPLWVHCRRLGSHKPQSLNTRGCIYCQGSLKRKECMASGSVEGLLWELETMWENAGYLMLGGLLARYKDAINPQDPMRKPCAAQRQLWEKELAAVAEIFEHYRGLSAVHLKTVIEVRHPAL